MPRVLVVATSRKTRGGITAVLKAYENTPMWKKYHCHWVQTHRDGRIGLRVLYFVLGFFDFLICLPFYDIVHIHTSFYGSMIRKNVFARVAKLFRKKLIIHLHTCDSEMSICSRYEQAYKFPLLNSNKILVLSKNFRNEVLEKVAVRPETVEVFYNPCPVLKPSNPSERQSYILFAGNLNKLKGYHDLIMAFASIAHKYPEWKLKLAGNGEVEEGKTLVQKLGVESQVEFLGWVNGKNKDNAFRHASIYCLPSYTEGFPMGVLDAWAYHLPVVTTPVGGLSDVAIDGVNAMLFNPGDEDALARKLELLISDNNIYNNMINASMEFASEKFNINKLACQLSEIYDAL